MFKCCFLFEVDILSDCVLTCFPIISSIRKCAMYGEKSFPTPFSPFFNTQVARIHRYCCFQQRIPAGGRRHRSSLLRYGPHHSHSIPRYPHGQLCHRYPSQRRWCLRLPAHRYWAAIAPAPETSPRHQSKEKTLVWSLPRCIRTHWHTRKQSRHTKLRGR